MECKAESQKSKSNLYVYWNISRMECKDTGITIDNSNLTYWNISRMECKGENNGYGMRGRSPLEYIQNGM